MLCLGLGNRKTVAEYHKEALLLLEVKPDIDNNDAPERHPGGMGNPSLERPVHQHQSVHNPRGGRAGTCCDERRRKGVLSDDIKRAEKANYAILRLGGELCGKALCRCIMWILSRNTYLWRMACLHPDYTFPRYVTSILPILMRGLIFSLLV